MAEMTSRPSKHAHRLVKETAVAMAHELYDAMMRDDLWYDYWRNANPELGPKALEEKFVQRNLSKLIPQARATLAQMLRSSADPELQATIYDALLLDNTLIRGRDQ